jgi:hypothetical protein
MPARSNSSNTSTERDFGPSVHTTCRFAPPHQQTCERNILMYASRNSRHLGLAHIGRRARQNRVETELHHAARDGTNGVCLWYLVTCGRQRGGAATAGCSSGTHI